VADLSTAAPVSPRTIDRILRNAGHPRHDGRTRLTKYSPGYTIDEDGGSVIVRWDGGHDDSPGPAREALALLVPALAAAGYRAARGDVVAELDGHEWSWPCLIVTRTGGRVMDSLTVTRERG